MNILSTKWKSTHWKPNNTLEITLSNDCVIILKDVSFANYLALSSNPTLLDKMILSEPTGKVQNKLVRNSLWVTRSFF